MLLIAWVFFVTASQILMGLARINGIICQEERLELTVPLYCPEVENWAPTPPTKSLWTVLPAAESTRTVRLFQQVAVRKYLYINQPNEFCFKGYILYCKLLKMITIGFTGTMYVCLLDKLIGLYHSTTYFAILFIFPPDFHQLNGDTRSRACYKVYGIDKLSNN